MQFKKFISLIGPLLCGVLFALGLGISGMTEPLKIISFLDVFGEWDPSLSFVMISAISVYGIFYRLIIKLPKPLVKENFSIPTKSKIDKSLLIGSSIFGIGWGVSGLCPGPGITAIVSGKPYAVGFVICCILGMFLAKKFIIKTS